MSTALPESRTLTSGLDKMIRLAHAALEDATTVLLGQDRGLDGSIASFCHALDLLGHALEDHTATLLAARGGPEVRELPRVIAAVQINAEVESLGGLARRLAEIACDRRARPVFPNGVSVDLREMARGCLDLVDQAAEVVAAPTSEVTDAVGRRLAQITAWRRQLYQLLFANPSVVDVEIAVDAAVAARYYERAAAHTASMIEHTTLLAESSPQ